MSFSKSKFFKEVSSKNINKRNEEGETILHQAVEISNYKTIRLLIKKGAEVNARDKNGYTPLHCAVFAKSLENIKVLLREGAEVNATQYVTGCTPLHSACKMGGAGVEIIKELVMAVGTLPLGYDVKEKELIINEKEAKIVKHIFERYMELKSMAELARELNSQGYRTKSDIFKKATVRRIITNPIYMGKIRHYEKEYEGKHEAIIEEEKWQKAQELIKDQPYRKAKYEEALLKGIIKCKSCNVNMTLTYAKKENKRYRYYVCNNHLVGKSCASKSRNIVAGEIEKEVMRKTEQLYEKGKEKTEEKWKNLSFGKQKEVVKKLIKGVMVKEDGMEVHSESEKTFIAMNLKKKGNKCTVVEPEGKTNNALLKAVVRAHLWKRQLEEGKYANIKELSKKINIGTRRIQQILRLNYLAPKIKEDIVNGR